MNFGHHLNIFINDISQIEDRIALFADDAVVYTQSDNFGPIVVLTEYFVLNLSSWSVGSRLIVHESKNEIMHVIPRHRLICCSTSMFWNVSCQVSQLDSER